MNKLKQLEKQYDKVLIKLERLNEEAFNLEKEMMYERNKIKNMEEKNGTKTNTDK